MKTNLKKILMLFICFALFSTVSIMVGCGDEQIADNDWPMFGRTPEGNRVAPDKAGPQSNMLELKWNWENDTRGYITTDFIFDNNNAYFGTSVGTLYCFKIEPFQKVWEFKTGDWIVAPNLLTNGKVSSPAISNGKVYFGSWDRKFYCLSADKGKKIWEYKTGGNIESSPAISNSKVYFGSNDSKFYCLLADDGQKFWEYQTGASYTAPH